MKDCSIQWYLWQLRYDSYKEIEEKEDNITAGDVNRELKGIQVTDYQASIWSVLTYPISVTNGHMGSMHTGVLGDEYMNMDLQARVQSLWGELLHWFQIFQKSVENIVWRHCAYLQRWFSDSPDILDHWSLLTKNVNRTQDPLHGRLYRDML